LAASRIDYGIVPYLPDGQAGLV